MGRPSAERGTANATRGRVQTLCKFSRMRLKQDVCRERTESKPRRLAGIAQPPSPLVFCCRIHLSIQDLQHRVQLRVKTKAAPTHIGSRLKFKRLLAIRNPFLEQTESDFDRHLSRNALSARADGRPELPLPNSFNRFFVKSEARALDYLDVSRAPIERDDHHQYDHALIFRLARFVRILWIGTINAARHPNAIYAGAERSASCTAAFTRSQAPTRTTADARSIPVPKRFAHAVGQWIAESRGIDVGNFQVWRAQQRRVHRKLGIRILDLYLWWSKLRPLELRQLATVHRSRRVVVGTAASASWLRSGRKLWHIGRNIDHTHIRFSLCLRG